MRSARLGIALGLKLDTDVGFQMALTPDVTPEAHLHQFMDELRGLLTLRYRMEKKSSLWTKWATRLHTRS